MERNENTIKQVEAFCLEWQNISTVYEDYARTVGVAYTGFQVLNYITRIENCTQKIICERSFLPKQTVNNIITGFYKDGYVELREMPDDRRIKSIHLTEKGQEYISSFIPHIREAEYAAMDSLSEDQKKMLIESIRLYSKAFREKMFEE